MLSHILFVISHALPLTLFCVTPHTCCRAAAAQPSSLDLLGDCLGASSATHHARLRDTCVHAGPVTCILLTGGRGYTAGGAGGGSAVLLVWDSSRCELLRTISKRSTRWAR